MDSFTSYITYYKNSITLAPNRALKDAIQKAQREGTITSTTGTSIVQIEKIHSIIAEELPEISLKYSTQFIKYNDINNCDEYYLHLSTICEDRKTRVPTDIVVVVDVSGSMGMNATTTGVESTNLTILDIVKHAVKTIIATLNEKDRLSVVSFSDSAHTIFQLTYMSINGKTQAIQALDSLDSDGMTNIWDGINTALNILKNRIENTENMNENINENESNNSQIIRNSSVLLLTDGEPNINPPRGILPMLLRYKDTNDSQLPAIVSTFGFGYKLDSKLLYEMSELGQGMYAFIPDSGFVGTAFVNALANTLTTIAIETVLTLELNEGCK